MAAMSPSDTMRKRSMKANAHMLHATAQRLTALSEGQYVAFWSTSSPRTDGRQPTSATTSHWRYPFLMTTVSPSLSGKTSPFSSWPTLWRESAMLSPWSVSGLVNLDQTIHATSLLLTVLLVEKLRGGLCSRRTHLCRAARCQVEFSWASSSCWFPQNSPITHLANWPYTSVSTDSRLRDLS
jgi:hypothetical protein